MSKVCEPVTVTDADFKAALGMLEHAFRNVSPRFLHVVDFDYIAWHFAAYRRDTRIATELSAPAGVVEAIWHGEAVLAGRGTGTYDEALTSIRLLIAALSPASEALPYSGVREAVQAVLDNADRPGRRMHFESGPSGEDIWVDHKEVDQPVLDDLAAALAATDSGPPSVEARLREALEPFANWSRSVLTSRAKSAPDSAVEMKHDYATVTLGDLRRVRSALTGERGE